MQGFISHFPFMCSSRFSPAVVLAALGLVVSGCSSTPAPEATPTPVPTEPQATETVSSPAAMEAASSDAVEAMVSLYKDGTYTVVGNYESPAGPEAINVTVTLAGDTVTEVEYVGTAEHMRSKREQANFGEGYRPMVVGKKIDDIQLVAVSGASLTTNGFMDALAKVKAEAKK